MFQANLLPGILILGFVVSCTAADLDLTFPNTKNQKPKKDAEAAKLKRLNTVKPAGETKPARRTSQTNIVMRY
jgi:hypothetical protein